MKNNKDMSKIQDMTFIRSLIIYGSQYGTTKRYAEELSRRTNIQVTTFKDVQEINNYDEIIYLGGLYAGGVLRMDKTLKKLDDISKKRIIIITVGLSDPTDETNINNIRNNIKKQLKKDIFERAKIFHLRGGIDYSKLNFAHKTMMKLLYNAVKNLPEEKKTAEDKAMIDTYNQKVDFLDFSSLDNIIDEIF